jgi:predicted small lipoprotein YifL
MRKYLLSIVFMLLMLVLAGCTDQPPAAVPDTAVPQPTTMVEPTTGASESPLPTPTPEPTNVVEPTSDHLTSPLPTPTPETSEIEAPLTVLLAVLDVHPLDLGD